MAIIREIPAAWQQPTTEQVVTPLLTDGQVMGGCVGCPHVVRHEVGSANETGALTVNKTIRAVWQRTEGVVPASVNTCGVREGQLNGGANLQEASEQAHEQYACGGVFEAPDYCPLKGVVKTVSSKAAANQQHH